MEATTTYPVHPVAALFPLLEGEALAALAEDIRQNGLREPIKRWNGMIIDGRNRQQGCEIASVEQRYEDLDFASERDVVNYIISLNLHRRHLDTSQRAMIAAGIANLGHGQRSDYAAATDAQNCASVPVTQAEASDMMNVSRRSLQDAKVVQDSGDQETIDRVKAGKESVSKAASKVKASRCSTVTAKRGNPVLPPTMAAFTREFKSALAVFENAKLPVQKEIVKKTATDFNAVIFFAGEEFRPQPVSMFGNGGAPANPVMQVNKPKFEELHDCGRQVGAVGRSAPKMPETPEPPEQQSLPTGDAAEAPPAAPEPVIEPMYFPGLQAVMDRRSDRMEAIDITAEDIIPPPWKAEGIAAEAVDVTSGEIPFPWRAEGIAASTLEQRLDFVREFDPELAGQVEKDKMKLEDAEAIVLELMAAMRSVLEYKLTSEEEQALVRYKARFPDGVAEKEMEAAKKAVEEFDAAQEAADRARYAKVKKLSAKLIKNADAEALEALAHKIAEEVEISGIDLEDREAVRDEGGINAVFENAITNEINAEFDVMAKGLIAPEALKAAAAEDYGEEQFIYCVIADLVTKAVKLAKEELRG